MKDVSSNKVTFSNNIPVLDFEQCIFPVVLVLRLSGQFFFYKKILSI